MSKKTNKGVSVSGNITIRDIPGQFAIGENITQKQYKYVLDIEELQKNLLNFQKLLDELNLPAEDKEIIKGDIGAAIRETKKDKPEISKIKQRFENVIDTLKETREAVTCISGFYPLAKTIAGFIGLSTSDFC
jgi:hypothetical protein